MRLNDWANLHRDHLREEPAEARIVQDLLAVVRREIGDAEGVPSDDGRLEHAYAACLAAAAAALAACGYRVRAGTGAHHYLAIESLQHTLGLSTQQVNEVHNYRRQRGRAMYERAGIVTRTEALSALAAARHLHGQLLAWLASERPHLSEP